MHRVNNKIAIVTGGAQGIGLGIAQKLVDEGATVLITDQNIELGQNVEQAVNSIHFLPHDVSKEEDWENVIKNESTTDVIYQSLPTLYPDCLKLQ